ncbi:MAG: winged helix-turn-helix domain-containing protein [Methanosarcinaceae archaeon]|nr:winged helix-turn-helix domain-containing protein [Methanosarcinaceae archaeon]MDD4332060.1 winged helix-turn-helix domain-containing protein [Methanosarcinaceae archaeon]MDD4749560.1 winged helix-turn-helix domain-containing protein [Methanosarcinaceae archaeon]
MNKSLLGLLFLSEKRKNILLLLRDGEPRSVDTLREALGESETSLQPQLKKLREKHLVVKEKNLYSLSKIGKVIVEKLPPLLNTVQIFEKREAFWAERDLKAIPLSFQKRIGELGKYRISEPDSCNHFKLIPEFPSYLKNSREIMIFLSYFHPLLPAHFLKHAQKSRKITLIVNEKVMERSISDFRAETEAFLGLENTKIYLCKEPGAIPSILTTDFFMAIAFFPKTDRFDRTYVLSFDKSALCWGKELFEYYKSNSEEIAILPEKL